MEKNTRFARNLEFLDLDLLYPTVPALTKSYAHFLKENVMVCFDANGHKTKVVISVTSQDDENRFFGVVWTGKVTDKMRRAYADEKRTTDNAACGIALLLIEKLTDYVAVRQSIIGTTIDYYLASKSTDDTLIFNDTARLEVSGILTENERNTVQNRIQAKLRRIKSEDDLSDYIIVVGFGKPSARWVKI